MTDHDGASTFAKGLRVLDCFAAGRTDLTMADLARLTGYDRATTRRLCLSLEQSGYVHRQDRCFRLTPKVMAVAGGYLSSLDVGKFVQPVLNQFAEALEGEIALAVRDGNRAIYIARSAVSSARISIGFSVGSTLPLLPTAIGRMLLAQCTDPERASLIKSCPLEQYTTHTNMDKGSIAHDVGVAARNGFAYLDNEFEHGAAGLAVPLVGFGSTQAVLATTASVRQLRTKEAQDKALDALRSAAISLRR